MSDPKRRFFQIHLSTAIAMMFVAAILLGTNDHLAIPRSETTDWVSADGLSARLIVKNTVIAIGTQPEFAIELRNDSAKTVRVFTQDYWPQLEFFTTSGEPIEATCVFCTLPTDLKIEEFTVLNPGGIAKCNVSTHWGTYNEHTVLQFHTVCYSVSAGRYKVKGTYQSVSNYFMAGYFDKALGATRWQGQVTTPPVEIRIQPPLTWSKVLKDSAIAFALLACTAVTCEWLIRRRPLEKLT